MRWNMSALCSAASGIVRHSSFAAGLALAVLVWVVGVLLGALLGPPYRGSPSCRGYRLADVSPQVGDDHLADACTLSPGPLGRLCPQVVGAAEVAQRGRHRGSVRLDRVRPAAFDEALAFAGWATA